MIRFAIDFVIIFNFYFLFPFKFYQTNGQIEDTSKIFKQCNAEISELCENIKHSLLVDKERAVEMIDIKDITNQAKFDF